MILTPYELPSRGLDKSEESISISPLGFQDLIEYSREYETAKSEISKYLIDFKWIKKCISNWKSINLVDLDAVILRWKIASVSGSEEFSTRKSCKTCGNVQVLSLSTAQLNQFIPIDFELNCEVVLGNDRLNFKCPSLEIFDSVVTKVQKSGRVHDIEILKLISSFPDFSTSPNKIESLVINAKLSDIEVLKTLISIYYNSEITISTKCTKCKEADWSMRVNTLIDNPFLSLVLSSKSIEDKILLRKVCRTEES